MRLIGGQLDIDSAGQGTTVRATIPLPMETNKLEKTRILIADDHGLVRRGAGSVLRPARLESRRRGSKWSRGGRKGDKAETRCRHT